MIEKLSSITFYSISDGKFGYVNNVTQNLHKLSLLLVETSASSFYLKMLPTWCETWQKIMLEYFKKKFGFGTQYLRGKITITENQQTNVVCNPAAFHNRAIHIQNLDSAPKIYIYILLLLKISTISSFLKLLPT